MDFKDSINKSLIYEPTNNEFIINYITNILNNSIKTNKKVYYFDVLNQIVDEDNIFKQKKNYQILLEQSFQEAGIFFFKKDIEQNYVRNVGLISLRHLNRLQKKDNSLYLELNNNFHKIMNLLNFIGLDLFFNNDYILNIYCKHLQKPNNIILKNELMKYRIYV